jgi:protocatechuate 3,4-dioxygenase beta subunit
VTRLRWTRRRFIAKSAGGAASLPFLGAAFGLTASLPEPSCALIQEQEEGPYYIDHEILRKDITEGKPGVPLLLRLTLLDTKSCRPIQNAALDIWHCDALGVYSGYTAFQPGGPGGRGGSGGPGRRPPPPGSDMDGPRMGGPPPAGGPPKMQPTDKQVFLRGVQLTDAKGVVEFSTIFPGCYEGRTNHIHLKVHMGGQAAGTEYHGGHVAHTGQIFFPEEITAAVVALKPYANHEIDRTTLAEDGVFNGQHGSQGMTNLSLLNPGSASAGYVATLVLGVDPDATPGPANRGRPPRRS